MKHGRKKYRIIFKAGNSLTIEADGFNISYHKEKIDKIDWFSPTPKISFISYSDIVSIIEE